MTAISTNHTAVLLNYQTTPDVTIWSAVICSSSLPGCMAPSPLMAKRYQTGDGVDGDSSDKEKDYSLFAFTAYGKLWQDGSIKQDVPAQRLQEAFGVKFTICVQCNAHVFVFYFNGRGTANEPIRHWGRSGMRGGFLSSFLERMLKLELRKWMTMLSDFDLMPQVLSIDLRHIALQQNRGTVTMNPRPSIDDFLRLTSDPDRRQMRKYLRQGAGMAFPYIYMIDRRLSLQHLIRDALQSLEADGGHKSEMLKVRDRGNQIKQARRSSV